MRRSYIARQIQCAWSHKYPALADFTMESPLDALASTTPNNKQASGSGSCFVIAPISVRQILRKAFPGDFPHGDGKEAEAIRQLDFVNRVRHWFGFGLGGGFPTELFQKVVGSFTALPITQTQVTDFSLLTHVKRVPCMLPYLPALPQDRSKPQEVYIASKEEFIAGMLENVSKQQSRLGSTWHSQAVVGLATHNISRQRYFVCRQSWEGFDITLIPVISFEDIVSSGGPRDTKQQVWNHHVLFVPNTTAPNSMGGFKVDHMHSLSMNAGGALWMEVPIAMTKTCCSFNFINFSARRCHTSR